jgi:hypothetical protein
MLPTFHKLQATVHSCTSTLTARKQRCMHARVCMLCRPCHGPGHPAAGRSTARHAPHAQPGCCRRACRRAPAWLPSATAPPAALTPRARARAASPTAQPEKTVQSASVEANLPAKARSFWRASCFGLLDDLAVLQTCTTTVLVRHSNCKSPRRSLRGSGRLRAPRA